MQYVLNIKIEQDFSSLWDPPVALLWQRFPLDDPQGQKLTHGATSENVPWPRWRPRVTSPAASPLYTADDTFL